MKDVHNSCMYNIVYAETSQNDCMAQCTNLLQQRIKTLQQNAFLAQARRFVCSNRCFNYSRLEVLKGLKNKFKRNRVHTVYTDTKAKYRGLYET